MFNIIKRYIKKWKRDNAWRKRNKNNKTICKNDFDIDSVSVGDYTYGEISVLNFGINAKLRIGYFCSIASGVIFNVAGDHYLNHISTFPFKAKMLDGSMNEAVSKGDIIVDDDVWIGQNAIILSGVHIGQGAVIAAGAVVANDVPPYAIVGGIPAKIIKYRFGDEMIRKLLTIDYTKLTKDMITEHLDDLYEILITEEQINWMPKKELCHTNIVF